MKGSRSNEIPNIVINNDTLQLVYSWIGPSVETLEKLIPENTERATTDSRPQPKSSRRGESKSSLTNFCKIHFVPLFQNNFPTIVQRKIVKAESDLPRRTICRGLTSF